MRATTGGSPARSVRSALHDVGAVHGDHPGGNRLLGSRTAADHRFARRSLPRAGPAGARRAPAHAGGSASALWRSMARAGTSSQRSNSMLRSVFSSDLVDDLVEAQRAKQRIAAQARDQLLAAGENSGLRSAEEFIAAEGDQIHAGGRGCRKPAAPRCRRRAGRRRSRCPDPRRPGCRVRARGPRVRAIRGAR